MWSCNYIRISILSAIALTILWTGKGLSYNIFDFIASERMKLLEKKKKKKKKNKK
jgi:hypothetical protein